MKFIHSSILILLYASTISIPESHATESDWQALTTADVQAIYKDIQANHPGPVNALDPEFNRKNDTAYKTALKRARTVRNYAGYYWTLDGYTASFNDGHVSSYPTSGTPDLPIRWPGFMTAFNDQGKQIVVAHDDNVPLQSGDELISCDGTGASALAEKNIGSFRETWFLASTKKTQGWRLFIDKGNPFISLPYQCLFTTHHGPQAINLSWKTLPKPKFEKLVDKAIQLNSPPIALHTLPDGTYWLSLSSFDGEPASKTAKNLTRIIVELKEKKKALLASPRIVIDLRENTGGSSDWSQKIAEILWGKNAVEAASGTNEVDWRASADNLASLSKYLAKAKASPDTSPANITWFNQLITGITEARHHNAPYWKERDDNNVTDTIKPKSTHPLHPDVFILTDAYCASACLDAVDLWRALGGIQVGHETSADTLYMDIQSTMLPSGLSKLDLPMKVYRGRQRGNNVPWTPVYSYDGDMRNTEAIATWISGLPPNKLKH